MWLTAIMIFAAVVTMAALGKLQKALEMYHIEIKCESHPESCMEIKC